MQEFKNITVSVPRNVYRRARRVAADYESSLSTIVTYLILNIAEELEATGYPKGGPREARRMIAERIGLAAAGKEPGSQAVPIPSTQESGKNIENPACETVKPRKYMKINHFQAEKLQNHRPCDSVIL